MRWIPTLFVIAATTYASVRDADACSPMPFEPFEGDGDGTAPGAITVSASVRRGAFFCPGDPQHSCGDMATLQLRVAPDGDHALPPAVRLAIGTGAPGFFVPAVALLLNGGSDGTGSLTLSWGDGTTFEQEALDFTVTLTPFDGDDGPATTVRITDPGRSGTPPCTPPVVDAVDAGSRPPLSGNDDAGDGEPLEPVGCGCAGFDGTWAALLLALARRRVTGTRV